MHMNMNSDIQLLALEFYTHYSGECILNRINQVKLMTHELMSHEHERANG